MTTVIDELPINPKTKGDILEVCETGSRIICNPPPKDTDRDILLLVKNRKEFVNLNPEWEVPVDSSYDYRFTSLRRGELNLIVTDARGFYYQFALATKIAKRLNVTNKADRIALFHSVLFLQDPDTKTHCDPRQLSTDDVRF